MYMSKEYPEELEFLEKLNDTDRKIFSKLTEEEKQRAITENKIAHEEEEIRRDNEQMNQLTDRIASKSFQG